MPIASMRGTTGIGKRLPRCVDRRIEPAFGKHFGPPSVTMPAMRLMTPAPEQPTAAIEHRSARTAQAEIDAEHGAHFQADRKSVVRNR